MIDEKELIEYLEASAKESRKEWGQFDDHGAFGEYHAFSSVIDCVNSMPKVGEWIPVTERLPENGRFVLVTDNYEDYETINTKSKLIIRRALVMVGYYENLEWWLAIGDCAQNVTAWMELPKPYRGDTDDSTM